MKEKKIDVQEMKQIQMQMMDLLDTFCSENKLNYYMIGGTAIGAVRHKGYIPWDDDIDVAIPRDDYERFLKEFKAEGYSIITCFNSPSYAYPFAKLMDDNTRIIEHSDYISTDLGVNIDVFPVDGLPKNTIRVNLIYLKRLYYDFISSCKCAELSKKRNWIKLLIIKIVRSLTNNLDMNTIAKKIDKLAKSYKYDSSCKVGRIAWGFYKKEIVDNSVYGEYEYVPFEDRSYRLANKYDIYLTQIYGNYMQLPPENQRKLQHDVKAFYINEIK